MESTRRAVRQCACGATDLHRLAVHRQRRAADGLGQHGGAWAFAPILGPQKAILPASLALIFASTAG